MVKKRFIWLPGKHEAKKCKVKRGGGGMKGRRQKFKFLIKKGNICFDVQANTKGLKGVGVEFWWLAMRWRNKLNKEVAD